MILKISLQQYKTLRKLFLDRLFFIPNLKSIPKTVDMHNIHIFFFNELFFFLIFFVFES